VGISSSGCDTVSGVSSTLGYDNVGCSSGCDTMSGVSSSLGYDTDHCGVQDVKLCWVLVPQDVTVCQVCSSLRYNAVSGV